MTYWEGYKDQRLLFYRDREQTARKEHKCRECKRTIKIGEKYSYAFGVWQDYNCSPSANSYKTCLECEKDWFEVLEVFHENGEDDANIIFGLLSEAIQDAFDAGFLKKGDRLVEEHVENLLSEERSDYERRKAVAQMRVNSTPFL